MEKKVKSGASHTASAAANPKGPLYDRLANSLREDILAGVYPVGSRLPTEEELCQRFSVSRYTIREALRLLREDGLVVSRQGAGTLVTLPDASDSDIHQVMSVNDLLAFATDTRFAIEAVQMVKINKKLASRTGLPSGEEWLEVRGYRYAEGVDAPVCWAEYYINRDYAAVGRLLQRHQGPIFPLIEDLFGRNITEVNQQISAALISAELAAGLKVKAGSAALEVRRSYRTADAKVAQVTINIHPASRFQHSMTMRRIKA